ncbi:MAG: glycosyltransferase [Flavobacteriales bacterium]|nr:glycosyltransferase [Flavobacteriales bacterium]
MKRVLVITYYWPPNGGAGVYRWLKMSKYLPAYGWQPIIYTPANPELVADDPELLKDVSPKLEVIARPITEPFSLYKRFTGKKQDDRVQTAFLSEEGRGGWKEDLALWVRSNFFVPDARVWWVRPSIRYLKEYLRQHPVDAIVTTGPPHSMHLIGRELKRALGVKWIADFRDPWTGIDFYQQLKLSSWADGRHRRMERSVLKEADRVITVSWSCAKDLQVIAGREVEVITNGFDPADVPSPAAAVDQVFSLVHVGSMSATRDCPGLWKALAELCANDTSFGARFKLRFIGPVDRSVLDSVRAAGLEGHVERIGRVSHHEAMVEMQRARVLLLSINDVPGSAGILTSKLFEYLSVGRPILAIGPADGDVARVLNSPHLLVDRSQHDWSTVPLRQLFDAAPTTTAGREYSRVELAEKMAGVLGGKVSGAAR